MPDGLSFSPELRGTIDQAKADLAAALRLAVRFGFEEGICNHFTYAIPGRSDLFLLHRYGKHWSQMRASDILLLNADGKVLEGEGEAEATAFWIHSRVHVMHPRARAVLHSHMPYATALTCLADPRLLPLSQTSLKFWNEVAYDPDYNGIAVEREEGDRIAAALGDKSIVFMANHGVMVVAETIARAFEDLYYLERAAELQVKAFSSGQPLKLISDNIAGMTKSQMQHCDYSQQHFTALKELLVGEQPDYRS
jgi:ribulose-5-phosphate 4-epimerase/fuculose-1-phosphate aldolase